jgi:hypothetical protein
VLHEACQLHTHFKKKIYFKLKYSTNCKTIHTELARIPESNGMKLDISGTS